MSRSLTALMYPWRTLPEMGAGRKLDSGKRRWDLVPFDVLDSLVDVLTHGAAKYAPNNWRTVAEAKERYFAAMMRHLSAYRQGEFYDPESALPHLSHALCNIVFLLWFHFNGEGKD